LRRFITPPKSLGCLAAVPSGVDLNRLIFQMLGSTLIGLVICLAEHPEVIAQLAQRAVGQMRPGLGGVQVDSAVLGEQIAEKLADKNLLQLLDSPEFREIVGRVLGKSSEPATRPNRGQRGQPFDFQSLVTEPPLSERSIEITDPSAQSEIAPPLKIYGGTARQKDDVGEATWPGKIRRNQFVD
jgi:hypothetical protein